MKNLELFENFITDFFNKENYKILKFSNLLINFINENISTCTVECRDNNISSTAGSLDIFIKPLDLNIIRIYYYAKIETYDWDDLYNGYNVDCVEPIHLSDFIIFDSFYNIKDAKKSYKMMMKAKKFNI